MKIILMLEDTQIRKVLIGYIEQQEVCVEYRGISGWAIVWMRNVYNKFTKEFEYEPLPSNRSDKFIVETRFSNLVEAMTVARTICENIIL